MKSKLLVKTDTFINHTIDFLAFLGGVCVISIMLLMCFEVVMRYLFRQGQAWALEFSTYMLLILAFLGAAWLLRERGHVNVDLVLNRLNPKAQALVNLLTSIMGIAVCVILTWYGWETVWDHFQRGIAVGEDLPIPKAPLLAFIPLGCFFLLWQFLRQAYGYLRHWKMKNIVE